MAIAPGKVHFGCWQLDEQRRALCADGVPVPLHGKAFDLLVELVARHGQAVTRDELIANVWPGTTVGENNLTVQMSNLRTILKEVHADGAGLIVTVPGRGYKFTGDVREEPEDRVVELSVPHTTSSVLRPQSPATIRGVGWLTRVAASAALLFLALTGAFLVWRPAPTAPRLSIAVLPFRSLSPDSAQSYLADALTDDLITDLAHIPASTVIARESTNAWRSKTQTAQQIGQALMVRYLLTGSLRAEDGRYHVNAQLIDAANGATLWASRFDFPDGKISDVRNAIVGRLASALDFKLAQVESARSFHDRPNDPDALDLFFQARAILDSDNSLPELTRAQHLLERALQQQPDFGDAAAELGTLLMMKVMDTDDPQESSDFSEAHLQITHALALAPLNAQALAARAREFASQNKWMEASSSARAALAVEPSSVAAHVELARCFRAEGRLDEAADEIEAILRLSPGNATNKRRYLTLGFIRLMQYRTRDALGNLHMAVAGEDAVQAQDTMGRSEVTHLLIIAATFMLGDANQAHALYVDYSKIWLNRTVWRFAAYFRKSEARLPAFASVLNALNRSGMPMFADEHFVLPTASKSCLGGDFDISPQKGDVSETWYTSDVTSRLKANPALFMIDIGHGAAVPPGAIWSGWGAALENRTEFAKKIVNSDKRGSPGNVVVIMGNGTFECDSYRLAEAVAASHPGLAVKWYRGGEEAWAAANLPIEDRRP